MIHLRMVAPKDSADDVMGVLRRVPSVSSVVRLQGAASRPDGDLILADVAREDASALLAELRALGLDSDGSIALDETDTTLSKRARRAEQAAAGSPADAVIWEEVEARTSESTELSFTFLGFMVLATLIAAVGILNDSIILIIGAMVVGPEFGPLAAICVALVTGRTSLARRSLAALAVGFPLAIAASAALTLILRAAGEAPETVEHPETLFISDPNIYSVLVAGFAGIAGMLSLSTAKSGALIGVLISVTTIPAAGNVGVAAAYGNWDECRGAALQLAINLSTIVVVGVATLAAQRGLYARRRRRFHERLERRGGLSRESRRSAG
jgi:uncharacterized hydrophobic protein (TIGR00271 family)